MVGSAHIGLEVPEEAFHGVGVDVAFDVDALGVAYTTERVLALALHFEVAAPVVREDQRCRQNELAHSVLDRTRCGQLVARLADNTRADSSLAFDGGKDDCAVLCRGPLVTPSLRA